MMETLECVCVTTVLPTWCTVLDKHFANAVSCSDMGVSRQRLMELEHLPDSVSLHQVRLVAGADPDDLYVMLCDKQERYVHASSTAYCLVSSSPSSHQMSGTPCDMLRRGHRHTVWLMVCV